MADQRPAQTLACSSELFRVAVDVCLSPCAQPAISLSVSLLQEIIAINQDKLGVPGDLVWQQGTRKVSGLGGSGICRWPMWLQKEARRMQWQQHACVGQSAACMADGCCSVTPFPLSRPPPQHNRSLRVRWRVAIAPWRWPTSRPRRASTL